MDHAVITTHQLLRPHIAFYYLIIPCHYLMFDFVIIVLGFQDQTVALYTGGENGGYGHRRCGKLEFKL